jgi:hypothetical protein
MPTDRRVIYVGEVAFSQQQQPVILQSFGFLHRWQRHLRLLEAGSARHVSGAVAGPPAERGHQRPQNQERVACRREPATADCPGKYLGTEIPCGICPTAKWCNGGSCKTSLNHDSFQQKYIRCFHPKCLTSGK